MTLARLRRLATAFLINRVCGADTSLLNISAANFETVSNVVNITPLSTQYACLRLKRDPEFYGTPVYRIFSDAVGWYCHGINLLLALHRQHLTLWKDPIPLSSSAKLDVQSALSILGTCMVGGSGLRHIILTVLGYAFGIHVDYQPMSKEVLRQHKVKYLSNHVRNEFSDDESEGEVRARVRGGANPPPLQLSRTTSFLLTPLGEKQHLTLP